MDKTVEKIFSCLHKMFPRLSEAGIKEGVFFGPQIHKMSQDEHFNNILTGEETLA